MIAEQLDRIDERMWLAIRELQTTILRAYPSATFSVRHAPDELTGVHLIVVADVDDPDEVGDLVMDRVLDLQVEESLPIHVLPRQTPERAAAVLAREREQDERDGDGGRERRRQFLLELRRKYPLPSHARYPLI